ncbi:MAG: SPOR domain-containing protein [Mediterranea sp.]|nr:SPOR domain-containing protein [Mediterranea sp.]
MKPYSLFIVMLFPLGFALNAQEHTSIITALQQRVEGEGQVTIRQAPHIEALLGTRYTGEGENILKVSGYRVQIYAGNNSREAREEAVRIASKVKDLFPDTSVYTPFVPPHWVCRAGDFSTIEEADALLYQLKSLLIFKELFIVKELINIHL